MASTLGPFDFSVISAISDIIAQTYYPGLSRSELERALASCGSFRLKAEYGNKCNNLAHTLYDIQTQLGVTDIVIRFISKAMSISLYTQSDKQQHWHTLREQLNKVLATLGLTLDDQVTVVDLPKTAESFDEIRELTSGLKRRLEHRNCHANVLKYCTEEILNHSLFHAMSEAAKSIPERIRKMTSLGSDGEKLFNETLGSKKSDPLIFINPYKDDSEISEQQGFKNLLTGIYGHFRNPRAHSTRLSSEEREDEFLDAFGIFSYVHRRLDRATLPSDPATADPGPSGVEADRDGS